MSHLINHEGMFRAFLAGKTLVGQKGEELRLVNKMIVATDRNGNRTQHTYPVEYWSIKVAEPNFVNGYMIPEPQHEPLAKGVRYFCPSLADVMTYSWTECKSDYQRLHNGVIHLNRAAAEIHNEAAFSLTRPITADNA